MQSGFDAHNPPFDRLSQQEVEELGAALDIGYFRPGETILARGSASEALHVVIKGSVEARDEGVLNAVLGPKDSFDSRALVHGAAGEDFTAAEETLCFLLPKPVVLGLISRNPAFAAFFYSEISEKLSAFADAHRAEGGVESVLRARVREANFIPAVFIDADATMEQAGHRMAESGGNVLFVRDGERTGVVTGMNLSKAAVLRRMPLETPVRDICHFDVISVDAEDFVFEALLLMTKHDKRRVAVRRDGEWAGFLEDIDILGLVAGNTQLIPGRIDRARSVDELAAPARDIQAQVERLHRQGVKVEQIAEITSDLNRRLFVRLFEPAGAALDPGAGLPAADGQRRAGRADGAHRPGQRAPAGGAGAGGGARPLPRGLLGRARRLRLSALPGQRHGPQPRLVAASWTGWSGSSASGCWSGAPTRR